MATAGALERDFFVLDGKTLTTGGSLNLTNGVLAIVSNDNKELTQNGRKVYSTFTGQSKDKSFDLLLGAFDKPVSQYTTNKAYESQTFRIADIEDIRVEAPQRTGILVDDFIIGYNGKPGTEITIAERTSTGIDITLSGSAIYNLGYKEGCTTVRLDLQYPYLDDNDVCIDCANGVVTMQELVEKAVAEFNATKLLGGVPVTDYVDALVVNSLNGALEDTVDYQFYNLTLFDNGDSTALARVQAQYPLYKVVRTGEVSGNQTIYTLQAPVGTSIANYTTSLASIIKGCEDCPAGYTEIEEGFVYSIAIEDDGVSLVTTVDDLPGFVTGTAVKIGGSVAGVGTYTVVVTAELTDAQITTFRAISAPASTAVFDLAGEVQAVCSNATTVSTAWVLGDICQSTTKAYTITIADDECGGDILADLQEAYPDLTIAIDTVNLSRTATLTGTSGTATITIGGIAYTATFNTDLTTTASDFITTNKAAIELATGGTITSSGATIILVAPSDSYPGFSIANATTNLAGTVAAAVGSGAQISSLCQTTYRTNVPTNIICEECSDEFRGLFVAEAPKNYGLNFWETSVDEYDAAAKMGIRFRGKPFTMSGSEEYRDDMPFYATSTRVSVAGGQATYIAENWESSKFPFKVKVLSIAADPEALGGYLYSREDQARYNLDGVERFEGNNYGKWLWGQESRLRGLAQYVQYTITIRPQFYYKLLPHSSIKTNLNILVEVGRHNAVENLLNQLASAAQVPAVQAFAK